MTARLPALSLAASPGRRARTIAAATATLEVGTSIPPIHLQHPAALTTSASSLHEISEGRFCLGVGVAHGPVIERLGVETGKPRSDMREYVATMRTAADNMGGLPRVVLATQPDKMVALSVELSGGIEAWFEVGVTPIVVPSFTSGGQAKAVAELFDAFA